MRLFRAASYKFIEKRRAAYLISAVTILIGVGGMIANVALIGSWQRYGVDFTGGSLVQVRFSQPTTDEEVRVALGTDAPPITRFGQENEFLIRAPMADTLTVDDVANGIERELEASYGAAAFEVVRTESVGPKIGAELQRNAALAILASFLLTLLYLWIRFEVRFGFAAIIATVHDIMITLGFLAVFRVEIALPTVAAVLTIVGYSLNDTIVVFDRIRENLGKTGARREDQVALVNRSINETLPRTVLTSGTTLAVLLALLILGGAVIRDFTVVLILGVLIGTFYSIFVASPALLEIRERWGDGETREKGEQKKRAAATV